MRAVVEGRVSMAFFRRRSLESYSPEQAHAYQMIRLLYKYLFAKNLDFLFGPVVFDAAASEHFLAYDGEYGDKWDCIHIPKLRAMRAGLRYKEFEIDYRHPRKQTMVETGNTKTFMKRVEQIKLVAEAMVAEASATGR